jgi:hypothetical protein
MINRTLALLALAAPAAGQTVVQNADRLAVGTTFGRYAQIGPDGRLSVDAHRLLAGPATFSTVVYCEGRCTANVVMRPARRSGRTRQSARPRS